MNCIRKSTTFESSITPQGGGVGKGEEEMEGTNPVVPFKIFWERHQKSCEQDYCSGKTVLAGELLLLKSCPLRLQGNLCPRRMGNGWD